MAKTGIKLKSDESQSIMGLRQLKSAFSLCLEFLIVIDRKDLENLLPPLRINCCKAASQLLRDVGQELSSPSLHQMPQKEHKIKFSSCGLFCLGTKDSDNPAGRIRYGISGFAVKESS